MMKITVAITGASGAIYAHRLLAALAREESVGRIYVVISACGRDVWAHERGDVDLCGISSKIELFGIDDFFTPIASGSASADAMVVVPASMGAVARIATGVSTNLIERAADVMIKERKPLLIVPREAPLSTIHLRNLTTLSEVGAIVIPAAPSFYSNPSSLDDLVDTVIERILDKIGLKSENSYRWKEK